MVKTVSVGTDQVIIGRNGALVSSKSEPGSWHVVTAGGGCSCKGYQYRGHCRHIAAVASVTTDTELATRRAAALAELQSLYDDAAQFPIR